MKNRVIVNTVPHSGTHLISSILDIIGYSQSLEFHWKTLSYKKVSLNWRTSLLPENNDVNNTEKKFFVSVASPMLVREDLVKGIIKKVNNNEYLMSHIPYSDIFLEILTELSFKGIMVIRDPRDMCLSMLNHIKSRPHHYAFDTIYNNLSSRKKRLEAIIEGIKIKNTNGNRSFGNIEKMIKSMLQWEKSDDFIFLKFEQLVGPKGGGTKDGQIQSIKKILSHLNVDRFDIPEIAENAFGSSTTFRKGQINVWKTKLSIEEKELFNKYDNFISSLGYEPTGSFF